MFALMSTNLTNIQKQVLKFIINETSENQFPPSQREIGAHFKWKANAAARCHLLALEKKGYIKTVSRISRGIHILKGSD
jgi:repressor LexA